MDMSNQETRPDALLMSTTAISAGFPDSVREATMKAFEDGVNKVTELAMLSNRTAIIALAKQVSRRYVVERMNKKCLPLLSIHRNHGRVGTITISSMAVVRWVSGTCISKVTELAMLSNRTAIIALAKQVSRDLIVNKGSVFTCRRIRRQSAAPGHALH
jgi:hypothetical protein